MIFHSQYWCYLHETKNEKNDWDIWIPWRNWKGPCKPAPSNNFVAIFQVAQNALKFAMSTLFCVKKCPCVFSRKAEMDKIVRTPLPLSLSPNNVGFWSLRAKTLCVCVLCYWRGEMDFHERVWRLVEINTGTFFHRKRVGMANFGGFWATWKIATKLSLGAGLHGPVP